MIPNKTDIAIIGSGLGGMICALELQRHGFDVCIFEKSTKPGGYAHSFKRKGFTFDVSLHHLGGLEKGGLTYEILKPLGVLDKLEFEKRETLFTSHFPNRTYTIPNSKDDILVYLSEIFPAEKDNLIKMFDYLEQLKNHTVSRVLYNDFDISPTDAMTAKHRDHSFDQLISLFINDDELKAIFGQLWMYLGLPPEMATANYSNCIFTSSFIEGSYHIKGGGESVSKALVETLNEKGVKVFCKNGVKQIIVENNSVKGVELDNGAFIEAKYVVSNADPYQTIFELLPENKTSPIFKHRLNQMELSLSIYSMYIGLNCTTESLNIPDSNYFHNESYNLLKSYNNSLENKIKKTDWCLSNYASSFNEFSSDGNGVISIAELTSSGDWFSMSESKYKIEKERVKNILLDKYDKQFPGLKDHIKVIEFGTPRTMKRYSGNKGGAIYGLAQTINQSNNKRLGNRLPLNGLFLVGSWTQAGGGYEGAMMGGLQTAHSLLEYSGNKWLAQGLLHSDNKTKIPENNYLQYPCTVKAYPDDVDHTGCSKATGYLRFLDRSRVDLGNQSEKLRELKPILDKCHVNLYEIIINIYDYAALDKTLDIRSGFRKNTSHRAAVDQVIYDNEGNLLVESVSNIMFVEKDGGLIELPDAYSGDVVVPFDISGSKLPKILFANKEHYTHSNKYTIYYEDTDAQGIVYNVSYVKICEKAFWDIKDDIYASEEKINAKPSRIEIRFAKSSVLGDELNILSGSRIIDDNNFVIDYKVVNNATSEIISTVYMEYRKE